MNNNLSSETKNYSFHFLPQETKDLYYKLKENEPEITEIIQTISNNINIELHSSIKSKSSVVDKILRKAKDNDYFSTLKSFNDIIRYTVIIPAEDFVSKTFLLIEELEKYDFQLLSMENKFIYPEMDTHYKGFHLNLLYKSGEKIELQIHTPESYQVKKINHPYYVISRDQSGKYSYYEKIKANEFMISKNDEIPVIPNISKLKRSS